MKTPRLEVQDQPLQQSREELAGSRSMRGVNGGKRRCMPKKDWRSLHAEELTRVRELLAQGFTQAETAEAMGCSIGHVCNLRREALAEWAGRSRDNYQHLIEKQAFILEQLLELHASNALKPGLAIEQKGRGVTVRLADYERSRRSTLIFLKVAERLSQLLGLDAQRAFGITGGSSAVDQSHERGSVSTESLKTEAATRMTGDLAVPPLDGGAA